MGTVSKPSRPNPSSQSGASSSTEAARAPLPVWKKLTFAVLAIALTLVTTEGLLLLLGVHPQHFETDPFVGFSASSPLFVEQAGGSPGSVVMRTATRRLEFFNPQEFPKTKAPGTFRVFSMGGSTTYGHPYFDATSFNGWLREYLAALAPDRRWECINAGGISYGSYRVARLMEELIQYQPDLFVIYSGHNEFLERRVYNKIRKTSTPLRALGSIASRSRAATLMKRIIAPVFERPPQGSAAPSVLAEEPVTELEKTLGPSSYTRSELAREQAFEHYEFNVNRMIDIARSVGAQVLFVTPASNLREVSPFKSEHRAGLSETDRTRWKALYDTARRAYADPSPEAALPALAEAEAIDDQPASLHYVRGRVLEKLGRYAEAKASLERARDEDVCPLRAPSTIRSILSRVTSQRRVPLIDFQSFIEARSDNGITGASWFLDHVHLTVEGYRLLSLEILRTMESMGLVRPSWDTASLQRVTQTVTARIDSKTHALALMNLCKVLGWAGKRDEAYRAAVRAVQLAPDIARIQYEAGLAAQLSSRTNEALQHYTQAVTIDPRHSDAHTSMGVILEDRGQLPDALRHFQAAVETGKPADRERNQRNLQSVTQKLQAPRTSP